MLLLSACTAGPGLNGTAGALDVLGKLEDCIHVDGLDLPDAKDVDAIPDELFRSRSPLDWPRVLTAFCHDAPDECSGRIADDKFVITRKGAGSIHLDRMPRDDEREAIAAQAQAQAGSVDIRPSEFFEPEVFTIVGEDGDPKAKPVPMGNIVEFHRRLGRLPMNESFMVVTFSGPIDSQRVTQAIGRWPGLAPRAEHVLATRDTPATVRRKVAAEIARQNPVDPVNHFECDIPVRTVYSAHQDDRTGLLRLRIQAQATLAPRDQGKRGRPIEKPRVVRVDLEPPSPGPVTD